MDGKRRLMAVLEADVVGYSKLVAQDEQSTAELLADRRRLFEHYANVHHGALANQNGDSFLLTFDSALDAVQAAFDLQTFFSNQHLTRMGKMHMHFRFGVDLGDVWEDKTGQLVGTAVNTAARLEALAEPGGICVSEAVFRQVQNRVQIEFVDAGERDLKNIPTRVRAYKGQVYAIRGEERPSHATLPSGERPSRIPRIGAPVTDQERVRFMRDAFAQVQENFRRNLEQLRTQNTNVETDLEAVTNRKFVAKAFVNGRMAAVATIWLGNSMGRSALQIYYSGEDHGSGPEGSFNECIDFAGGHDLHLKATMGMHFSLGAEQLDLQNLSEGEAAEYLWCRFVEPLDR